MADNGGIIVALPTISEYFGTDIPTTQWVFLSYALTVSALLLPMGKLAETVGLKKVYIAGFVTFSVGALLAGLSADILQLIGSRVLMGMGAAMTQGTSMAMAIAAFPNAERGKILGLQMSVVGAGHVAGPAIGGLIISVLGWRGILFTTAGMGAIAIIVGMIILDGRRARQEDGASSFDWLGATLSASMLVVFLLVMTSAPKMGWANPLVVIGALGAAFMLGVFIWWELRSTVPLLDLTLFKQRLFSLGVAASFLSFIGSSSVRFMIPFYLQAVLGYSPRQLGLIIIPAALTITVTGPLGGLLSDRYGWRKFNVAGLTLSAIGLFLLSRLTEVSPVYMVMVAMVINSAGSGIFNAPNSSSILSTVDPTKYATMSGFLNLVRNSANVTGIVLATAIVTSTMASLGYLPSLAAVSEQGGQGVLSAFTTGFRYSFTLMSGLVALGIVLSFIKGDRQKTMAR